MENAITYRTLLISDYDELYGMWIQVEQTKRALNPVDDSREGITRYIQRNPNTCIAAICEGKIVGAILTGHDGRREHGQEKWDELLHGAYYTIIPPRKQSRWELYLGLPPDAD